MALTRATKAKRLASLDEQIIEAGRAIEVHAKRVLAAKERAESLQEERDWLAQAPVSDPPEDEAGGGQQ